MTVKKKIIIISGILIQRIFYLGIIKLIIKIRNFLQISILIHISLFYHSFIEEPIFKFTLNIQ